MLLGQGYVVASEDVKPVEADEDTAETRVAVDASAGSKRLEQRVVRFGPGRSKTQSLDGRQGLMYVVAGSGSLEVGGHTYELVPEMGVYLAGDSFIVDNPDSEDVLTVLVTTPAADGMAPDPNRRTVKLSERDALPAGTDREFRYLIHRDVGCPDVTQFVGVIPPGRAPDHSHDYDEVVYVLEGQGKLHVRGESHPIGPGTCMHLPPRVEHALENESGEPMRVLGVFHPSGDPASRAFEANG